MYMRNAFVYAIEVFTASLCVSNKQTNKTEMWKRRRENLKTKNKKHTKQQQPRTRKRKEIIFLVIHNFHLTFAVCSCSRSCPCFPIILTILIKVFRKCNKMILRILNRYWVCAWYIDFFHRICLVLFIMPESISSVSRKSFVYYLMNGCTSTQQNILLESNEVRTIKSN